MAATVGDFLVDGLYSWGRRIFGYSVNKIARDGHCIKRLFCTTADALVADFPDSKIVRYFVRLRSVLRRTFCERDLRFIRHRSVEGHDIVLHQNRDAR